MNEGAALSLDTLRARIAALEGGRVSRRREPTGVQWLDGLLRGLPTPGLVEVLSTPGMGATSLVAQIVAASTRREQLCAWVDVEQQLYPPALVDHGVDLRYLLIVRPTPGHGGWAAEQLLRSGNFRHVVVSGLQRLGRMGRRWVQSAEKGCCSGIIVSRKGRKDLPAHLRLSVQDEQVTVLKDRTGLFGCVVEQPRPSGAAEPWQWRHWSAK